MARWERRGCQVYLDGEPFGCLKDTEEEAEAYMERARSRHPNGLPSPNNVARVKGGPWRWRLPDGSTGVIHTGRKEDAQKVLRHNLQCQRLPNGITWEIGE